MASCRKLCAPPAGVVTFLWPAMRSHKGATGSQQAWQQARWSAGSPCSCQVQAGPRPRTMPHQLGPAVVGKGKPPESVRLHLRRRADRAPLKVTTTGANADDCVRTCGTTQKRTMRRETHHRRQGSNIRANRSRIAAQTRVQALGWARQAARFQHAGVHLGPLHLGQVLDMAREGHCCR